jgi:hypothetical protein
VVAISARVLVVLVVSVLVLEAMCVVEVLVVIA